jgi:uncharacterized repeat protein (TIGR01451 family)
MNKECKLITTLLASTLAAIALIVGLEGLPVYADPDPAAPELLLTEIVVTPTEGEFIEIYNPGSTTVDLSDVYLTDATYAPGSTYYYNIVTGSGSGGGNNYDFHARFPNGASIAPGVHQTIALAGSDDFVSAYGITPTYELYEDGGSADSVPDMREATSGSIYDQSGLSNGGEVVILYYWDGQTDLVTDLDYAVWGDKAEAVDKTGVSIDGPDADVITSTYLGDTAISSQDVIASSSHASGSSWQRQDLTEGSETKTGGNGASGHDETSENLGTTWSANTPSPNTGVYDDLRVEKEGGSYAAAGSDLVYTITVQNTGITPSLNVVLTDALPISTTYVSDGSGWTCVACTPGASGVITWTVAEVLSQTTHAFPLTVTVDASVTENTVLTNTVQIHTETAGDHPSNNTDQWTSTVYPLVTIQDIQYVSDPETDDASPLEDQIVWVTGTVTAEPGDIASNIFVIEDPAGGAWSGLPVYRWSGFSGLSLPRGTQVRLLGEVTEYNGLTELDIGGTPAALEIMSTGNPVPGPDVISTNSFGSSSPATAEQWEGVLVEFQNATVTNDNLGYGEWEFDDGSGPAHADDGGTSDGDMTYEPSNGDFYFYLRGIAYYTFGEYKLEPRDDADIRLKATGPTLSKSAPSLVAPGERFTYTLTIQNDLGFTLNDLTITDTVPTNATFAYALDGGVEDSGVVSWTVPSVTDASSVSVRFVVTATASPAVVLNDDYAVVASNFVTPTAGASVGTVVSSEPLRIRDIQGAGHLSPLNGQSVQDVRGIVTLIVGNGFYIQDPDADSNLATSEGIFVFGSSGGVSVGDDVLVDGTVNEFYNAGSAGLSTTRIELQGSPTISSTGNALPAPVIIGVGGRMPPTEVIDDDAGGGSVETAGTFDPQTDGIDFYESLEGMLVQINDPIAVGPTSYDAIPVVGDGGAYATFMAERGGVMAGIVIREDDFNPERLLVANPDISDPPDVDVGDHLTGPITGTIDYDDVQTYGNFYLVNANSLSATSGGLAPETTTLTTTEDYLTVASFNVYNLDPGDTQHKFDGLANQIVNNLGAPDIVGLQEIQDNNGETDDGTVDASLTYSTLITAILDAGGPTYVYADIAPENNQDGGAPGANIRVGFLYRPDRVTLVQRGVATATTATAPVIGATGVELTYSPGRIDPTNPAVAESRKSLASEFIFNGQKVFVIVNHFNSKSGDAPLFGNVQPPVFASEAERIGIAQLTNDFVDSILALDPSANVIVLGDLNDFHFSEAVSDVLAADVLTNLMYSVPITDRYTYVFEGNSQVLDQILVSDGLVNTVIPEFDVVHVNAEFVADIADSSRRASDHDPVLARFWLPAPDIAITKTVTPTKDLPLGSTVTYTITLSNSGDGVASGVVMTDDLPSEANFGGWVQQNSAIQVSDTITWTGDIAGNTQEVFVFTATVGTDSTYYSRTVTNTAHVITDNAGADSADATFTTVGPPDLTESTKVALADGELMPGDTITYVITLSNTGSADATVVVTDAVDSPQYLTPLTDLTALGFTEVTTGTWTFTRTVPAGQSVEVVFAVQVADLENLPVGQTIFGNEIWINDGAGTVFYTRTPSPPATTVYGLYLPIIKQDS